MAFYDLPKEERVNLVVKIHNHLLRELKSSRLKKTIGYFEDADTYIRKSAYLSIGRIYFTTKDLQPKIIKNLGVLYKHDDY